MLKACCNSILAVFDCCVDKFLQIFKFYLRPYAVSDIKNKTSTLCCRIDTVSYLSTDLFSVAICHFNRRHIALETDFATVFCFDLTKIDIP
jgi:hypothetical protein